MTGAAAKDGELGQFDAEEAILETSLTRRYTFKISEEYQKLPEVWGC